MKRTYTATKPTRPISLTLRLEGLALFGLSLLLYASAGASWSTFLWLFLLPDVSFAGYLFGPKVGACAYNSLHSELGPALLAGASLGSLLPAAALPIALIWAAHVGLDRALGYGLKYSDGFRYTHLGVIGRQAAGPVTKLPNVSIEYVSCASQD